MHDAGKILSGLVVFLAIATLPLWYHAVRDARAEPPEVALPAGETECVAPTEYMRELHMDLLNEWRDDSVRGGDPIHIGIGGKHFQKSFSGTCMNCHSNREQFCDRCHQYVGVDPYCWSCH
jgi:hypothetical protein